MARGRKRQLITVTVAAQRYHLSKNQVSSIIRRYDLRPVALSIAIATTGISDRRHNWYPLGPLERLLRSHYPHIVQAS